MSDESSLHAAIRQLYSAAVGETAWDRALDATLAAIGYDGAALYVVERANPQTLTQAPRLVRGLWHRLDPSGQDEYAEHYFKLDPRLRLLTDNPHQRLLHDYLHTPENRIDRDPYYAWHLKRQYTRYYLGGATDPTLPFFCGFTLHRRADLGPATKDEFERFSVLFGHLEHALLVERHIGETTAARGAAEEAFERNPAGLVLLDASGGVLRANAAAAAMAARADAFTLGATIEAMRVADNAALRRLIAAALEPGPAPPPVLRLPRRSGARDYVMTASGVRAGDAVFGMRAAVLLTILDPGRRPALPPQVLRVLFDLTQAEARVLSALAQGMNAVQAARTLGVSLPTVRSHLAAIFRKTETRRLPELLQLVAHLASLLPASPDDNSGQAG